MSSLSSVLRGTARAVLLLAVCAGASAQEETAQARAEKVRNALIDRALAAPSHVTSSAWLDESGQLRHVTRIYSEMRARATADFAEPEASKGTLSDKAAVTDVAPGSVASSQAGAAAAVSGAKPAGSAVVATSKKPEKTQLPAFAVSRPTDNMRTSESAQATCHTPSRGLRRVAEMHLQAHPWDGARGFAVVAEFEQILRLTMGQLAATGDFAISPSVGRTLGSYERLLTRQDAHAVAYRIEASIAPFFPSTTVFSDARGLDDRSAETPASVPDAAIRRAVSDDSNPLPRWPWHRDVTLPGQHFELNLGLREIASGRMLSQQRIPIYLPARPTLVGSSEVPESVRHALQTATAAWWSHARAALECEPLQVVAQGDVSVGQVLIPLGATAGVRIGDRWVLEDRARVPGRVLEEGALERARVAEVIAVTPHRAVLKLTQHDQSAAMPAERGVPWFATPM